MLNGKIVVGRCYSCRILLARTVSKNDSFRFKNPLDELQEYVEVPLYKQNGYAFRPSLEEMHSAEKLFRATATHKIKFLTSVINPEDFVRHQLPEVTFIGRSNVGKSSLLKALFSEAPEVHVKISKVPGHTKTINFYTVGNALCLVDVPGYGFSQPKHFSSSVEVYLKTRKNLKRTFLLIDGKIGLQHWDKVAVDMLEEFKIPYGIVMTKIDKASVGLRLKHVMFLQALNKKYLSNRCYPQPFLVSSVTGEGVIHLKTFITNLLGETKIDERLQLKPLS